MNERRVPDRPGYWWYRYWYSEDGTYSEGIPLEVVDCDGELWTACEQRCYTTKVHTMTEYGQWGDRIPTHRFKKEETRCTG